MNIIGWFILIMIGVYDARQHRIPNNLLILLFASAVFNLNSESSIISVSEHGLSMILMFSAAFLCYWKGWMAPGDVKLLAVVGFIAGTEYLSLTLMCIGISAVVIGLMYGFVNYLQLYGRQLNFRELIGWFICLLPIFSSQSISSPTSKVRDAQLVMPFAPVIVIGMALSQYLS